MSAPAAASQGPVDELIAMAARLVEMLERETALLKAMKPKEIAAFQTEKDRLADTFIARTMALKADPKLAQASAAASRATLKQAFQRVKLAMAANEKALKAAKETNERLVKAILDAAQAGQPALSTYARTGAPAAYAAARSGGGAIALDRVL